jgi:hypothetical protein
VPVTSRLLALVLAGKDEVVRQRHATDMRFTELYERLGRLVALHLEDPAKAVREAVLLADLECDLTGDCKATGDISELLDPEQEELERQHAPRYRLHDHQEDHTLDDILNGLGHTIGEDVRQRVMALKVGDALLLKLADGDRFMLTRHS